MPFLFEHPIPSSVVRKHLLDKVLNVEAVGRILKEAGPVTLILRAEDDALTAAGLRSSMPQNWIWGDDVFARYDRANIKISLKKLKVFGKIKR